jgi:hypothetical protein
MLSTVMKMNPSNACASQPKQLPVSYGRPSHLSCRLDLVADDLAKRRNRCTRQRAPSRGFCKQAVFRLLQKLDDLLATDRREARQKFINRVSSLQIVNKRMDGSQHTLGYHP